MSQEKANKSKVITFYSFKGGVGRSMALVNTATLLSSWGFKVLMVDWDLEAPGLENFFTPYAKTLNPSKQLGVLDLLHDLKGGKKVKWKDYVYSFSAKISKTPLDIIISGRAHEGYTDKLRDFNVGKFYDAHQGGYLLENLRNEWLKTYDFVLIDSRTGVTDFGGICTIQMPDILVMLLTPTEQGVNGTIKIAKRADEARRALPFDREKLLVFPLPSRIDSTTEFEQSRKWVKRFAKEFELFFDDWLPAGINREDFLQRVKVPYIAYFSYGEKLPVIEQGMSDTAGLGYAYENLAMLIGGHLDNADNFWESRSGYLEEVSGEVVKNGATASRGVDIYISCVKEDLEMCKLLAKQLSDKGKEYGLSFVFRNDRDFLGRSKQEVLNNLIDGVDIVVIWHSSDYANQMFANRLMQKEDDIEIQVIGKQNSKIVVPVFLTSPIKPKFLGMVGQPITPEFIQDRIGIPIFENNIKKDGIINAVDDYLMPFVAQVFQEKHARK